MDLVLQVLDDAFLDKLWASALPLKLPMDKLLRATQNATLSPTISSWARSAAATAYSNPFYTSSIDSEWITVSAWPRDDWRRQFLSLCVITMIGTHLLYFIVASLSYRYLFDHRMMQHPRFLKNQIKMEIMCSLNAFPWLTLLTVPVFVLETQGYSMCYGSLAEGPFGNTWLGKAYLAASCIWFLVFTDFFIYLIHRYEHHPAIYKHIHKPHHKWIIPTPFASHAFHPLDGFAQSVPYHAFIFLFPLHKYAYLGLFVFVNFWTIAIHDSDMIVDHPLEEIINGPAHHTLHHMFFTVNYGQYFVWCDRYFGSYRQPAKADDPLLAVLAKQSKSSTAQALADADRQDKEMAACLAAADKKSQ